MFVTNGSAGLQNIKQVADNTWTEGSLTYANRPPKGAAVTSFTPGAGTGVWTEVVITSAVAAKAGSLMSLAIDTADSDPYHFNSAEAASVRVELMVESVAPTPTMSPTPTPLHIYAYINAHLHA
jgi:hypothetical protein